MKTEDLFLLALVGIGNDYCIGYSFGGISHEANLKTED